MRKLTDRDILEDSMVAVCGGVVAEGDASNSEWKRWGLVMERRMDCLGG
jgi:hypothetical protein